MYLHNEWVATLESTIPFLAAMVKRAPLPGPQNPTPVASFPHSISFSIRMDPGSSTGTILVHSGEEGVLRSWGRCTRPAIACPHVLEPLAGRRLPICSPCHPFAYAPIFAA